MRTAEGSKTWQVLRSAPWRGEAGHPIICSMHLASLAQREQWHAVVENLPGLWINQWVAGRSFSRR
jgi:hypothetical protein